MISCQVSPNPTKRRYRLAILDPKMCTSNRHDFIEYPERDKSKKTIKKNSRFFSQWQPISFGDKNAKPSKVFGSDGISTMTMTKHLKYRFLICRESTWLKYQHLHFHSGYIRGLEYIWNDFDTKTKKIKSIVANILKEIILFNVERWISKTL